MYEKKYGNFLTVILIISIIAVVILLGYFIYDIYTRYHSSKEAEKAVDAFQDLVASNNTVNNIDNNSINGLVEENEIITENPEIPNNTDGGSGTGSSGNKTSSGNGGTTSKYAGYTMIGTIEIPKINIKTPIIKELTIDSLKKATILIYGNINEEGNAVIIGHNNRNGTFFSNLKKLNAGDTIKITDYTGLQIVYEVYDRFEATPDDTSFYQRDTNGLREISLSTCTDNDDTLRTIVLAREI